MPTQIFSRKGAKAQSLGMSLNLFLLGAVTLRDNYPTDRCRFFELDGKPAKFRKNFSVFFLVLAPLRLGEKIFFWKRWACCD